MMIQIGDKIVSSELFETDFICHLDKCHGSCCVQGDAGAPLENHEADIIEKEYEAIKEFISERGREAIEDEGKWVLDENDGEKVTPLIKGKECAYTVFENGIATCGIEKAWTAGKTSFRKPASCHLYPIRVSKFNTTTVLNYHHWGICEPARILGRTEKMPAFRFLKESIIRVYGEDFYCEMEKVYKELATGP
jgi:hypothetical protein